MKAMQWCTVAALLLGAAWGVQAQDAPPREVSADKVQDEDALIAVLQSDADFAAKQAACRGLKKIGSEKSIPVLAALLPDPELSNLARFALESMESKQVVLALRDALGKATGGPRLGIITSLGVRYDAGAIELIAPLLKDADVETARAAAGALGRIGTVESVAKLTEFLPSAPEAVHNAVGEGMVTGAYALGAHGSKREAEAIYVALLDGNAPLNAKMGAFRGLVQLRPKANRARVLDTLKSEDPLWRDFASQLIAETSGNNATKEYAAALPGLSAEAQVALVRGLGKRKDPAAHEALLQAIESGEQPVKLAAAHAISAIGEAEDISTLAALLGSENAGLAEAAMSSLTSLRNATADTALAAAAATAEPAMRAQLIELLTARMALQSVALATESIKSDNAALRVASLNALVQLGGAEHLPLILTALQNTTESTERQAAEEAVIRISAAQKDSVLPAVVEALAAATPETRPVLYRGLGQIGTSKALESVVAGVANPDKAVQGEAVRILGNWSTADAAPHLLLLAQSQDAALQDVGLKGYVRLARDEKDAGKKTEMLTTATGLAKRKEDKWTVLAAWGTLPTPQSLDTLQPYLDDPEVQNEAAAAIVAAATQLAKDPAAKDRAKAGLQAILDKVQNEVTRERATQALQAIG